ncbi:hypothetical protein [Nonomuraea sp. NPDC050783]|uniref:hypothetical protein n=1 Tax=Nonomuraea sp. NPDC050783 TaxID=3154634 RepID=UPI0034674B5E
MPAAASARPPLRAWRAGVFAAVAFFLGNAAHVVAGGSVPVASAVAALAVCFLPAYLLAGRERPLAVIVATLAGTQAALHLLFSAADAVAEAAGHAQHPHLGLVPDAGMLAMHGWAVALGALWLSHGETLLWSLLRRLAVRLRPVLLPLAVPAGYEPAAVPSEPPALPHPAPLRHQPSRRGPPPAGPARAA